MKFNYQHIIPQDTNRMDRPPILDWEYYYNDLYHSFKGGKFTGNFYKYAFFTLFLFRHEFGFSIEWGHGQTTPGAAKKAYHAGRNKCT